MKNRQTRTSQRWLGGIRSEMSPSRPVVAQSVIGIDGNSELCRSVAGELQIITSGIGRKLAAAILPGQIDVRDISPLAQGITTLEAWQDLAEELLVFVPKGLQKHAPSLILVMPWGVLQEDQSRGAILQQLSSIHAAYSSIVCVCMEDGEGEEDQHAWDREVWQLWLDEMAEALPDSVVRFYLVGNTASDGRLLTTTDQVTVAAHHIFADIVVRDRNVPRHLAQSLRRPEVSIGVLGMTGQIVSAESAASCLAPRLCHELIEELQSRHTDNVEMPRHLPTDPFQWLVKAFQHTMPFDPVAALERAESRGKRDYETPSLVGYDYRFTVNIGKAAKSLRLDGISPHLWRARLTELDALISSERADQIAVRASEYLDQLARQDEQRIQGMLRQAFASRLCDVPVQSIADSVLNRIGKNRNTIVVSGDENNIEESLEQMDVRVEKLGYWRSGLFATLLALLAAIAITWACNSWTTGAIRLWGTILSAASVAMLGAGAAMRWWWARHLAMTARDGVLEQIERRAQYVICLRIHDKLEQVLGRLEDSVRSSSKAICEAARVVSEPVAQSINPLVSREPLIETPDPNSEEMESVYRFVVHRPTEYGSLVVKLQDRCSDLGEELMGGLIVPADALDSLQKFLENELQLLLVNRMDIWRLYCPDGTTASFDDDAIACRVHQWAVPVLCGTGGSVANPESGGTSVGTAWMCPDALQPYLTSNGNPALVSMNDRILALFRMTVPRKRTAAAFAGRRSESENGSGSQ